jgi:hypothetical protein
MEKRGLGAGEIRYRNGRDCLMKLRWAPSCTIENIISDERAIRCFLDSVLDIAQEDCPLVFLYYFFILLKILEKASSLIIS